MNARTLLVMTSPRRSRLLQLLEENGLEVFVASGCREAQRKLNGPASYELLLVDTELTDGSWSDLLDFAITARRNCEVIVCSRCGDERLWAEVLQCGAYDLLVEPYECQEVHRIIESALDSQYMRRFVQLATARAS